MRKRSACVLFNENMACFRTVNIAQAKGATALLL